MASDRCYVRPGNRVKANGLPPSAPTERIEEGTELPVGFIELRRGFTRGDDPGARVEDRPIAPEFRATQRDRPFTVAARVHPSDRPGVRASIEALELLDDLQRGGSGLAPDRRRRVQHEREL